MYGDWIPNRDSESGKAVGRLTYIVEQECKVLFDIIIIIVCQLLVCVWSQNTELTSDQLTPFLAPASPPKQHFRGHCGPVCCVERSPFFRDILLSVGGWTFALWKEGAQVSERGGRDFELGIVLVVTHGRA